MRLATFRPNRRTLAAFAAAVVATAVAGSVLQTQVNLAAIAALGGPLTPAIRAMTTAEDIVFFGPLMAGVSALALIPAFAVGGLVARRLGPAWRVPGMAFAGGIGIWCAFTVLGLFIPVPSLFGALRGPFGLPILSLSGPVGGLVYAALTRTRETLGGRETWA